MSVDPEREPVVYPVFGWFEIVDRLYELGDGALAEAIYRAMIGRRLGDPATVELTIEERERAAEALIDEH
ncbi:MAG TPA: hypothetical protein VGR16_12360 [Thermomicrobiales bacterium]|nr:hypothetical protein [Thermomicrobiales bacterium]